MTNREAVEVCRKSNALSYAGQIGLITSLHLRKNKQIDESINADAEAIKKIGEERDSKETDDALVEFWNKEFEGNFFMITLEELGNIKSETIHGFTTNGTPVDAKTLAELLLGVVIIDK
jgi:hypothetical protein